MYCRQRQRRAGKLIGLNGEEKKTHIVAFVFTNTFSMKSHFMGFQMVYQ